MWYPDQKGLFLVRNGYWILHSSVAPHNPTMDPSTWDITWNLLIPGGNEALHVESMHAQTTSLPCRPSNERKL